MKGFRARWRSEPYCINEGSTPGHPGPLDTDPGQREPEIHGEADITLDHKVREEGDMQPGSPRVRLHADRESQSIGTGSADPVLLQEVHRVSDEAAVRFQPQLRPRSALAAKIFGLPRCIS